MKQERKTTFIELAGRVQRRGLELRIDQRGVHIVKNWGVGVKEVITSCSGAVDAWDKFSEWEKEHDAPRQSA